MKHKENLTMEKKINNSKVNTKDTVASTASNAWAGCRTYAHSEEDELLDLDKVTDSKDTATTTHATQFTTTGVTIPDLKERLTNLEEKVSTMEVKLDILQSLFNTAATALSDEDLIEEYTSETEDDNDSGNNEEEDSEKLEDSGEEECNSDHDGDKDCCGKCGYVHDNCRAEVEDELNEGKSTDDDDDDMRFWEYEEYMKEKRLKAAAEEKKNKKNKRKPSKEDRYYMRKIFDKVRQLPGYEDVDPSVLNDVDAFKELLLETAPLVALIHTMTQDGPFYYQGCVFTKPTDDDGDDNNEE